MEVECLARFSKTQPQAALAVFTHGLTSKWTHAFRVAAVLSGQHLVGLEKVICEKLIPALTNQPTQTQDVCNLLALPARLGGMGITNPIRACKEQREMSLAVTKPLVERIRKQRGDMRQCQLEMDTVKRQLRRQQRESLKIEADAVIDVLPPTQNRSAKVAQEKGSSTWLAALPIDQLGFCLSKAQFWDAVSMRYGWQLRLVPQKCRCGKDFEINHVLICKVGGFHTIRHNQLRDTTADLLREVCNDVSVEL